MPRQLTPEQAEELRSVDSPTVANATETFKVRDDTQGYMGMDIRCLTPEFGVMLGHAVTLTADSTTPGRARERHGLIKLFEAIAASPKPCVVVIKDISAKRSHSCHAGDVLSTMCMRLGSVGLLTDGGVRDLDGIRPLGFHVFAAGLVVAHGTFNIIDVGIPVEISEVSIAPGDLIHGDANGVTSIPWEIADKVYAECLKVREREAALRDYAHSREFSLEGLKAKLLGR